MRGIETVPEWVALMAGRIVQSYVLPVHLFSRGL